LAFIGKAGMRHFRKLKSGNVVKSGKYIEGSFDPEINRKEAVK
jgi:hypothetical protein